jgi:hypothetical protein
MKDVYFVERRENGDYAGTKKGAERASTIESTQGEAIARIKEINSDATIHVERVRYTDKGKPDKWRNP